MVTLHVSALSFSYAKGFSLKNLNFSIDGGQLCAVLGPNACGKTTLIKCLAGIFKINKGSVIFEQFNLATFGQTETAKFLSYVPQNHESSFSYTVLEMVLMGRTPYVRFFSAPKENDIEQSLCALSTLSIEHLKDELFTEISGGQQKLVLIARALAQETPIMLLDEPTAHLDFRNKLLVLNGIRRLVKDKELIVLMSLHDPNEVLLVADKIIIMKNGEIVSKGSPENVLTPQLIKEIYGIPVETGTSSKTKMFVPCMDSLKGDLP